MAARFNAQYQTWQSFYAFYAFYALGFIFRNRGPLQKVCCDTDTHAVPVHNCQCPFSEGVDSRGLKAQGLATVMVTVTVTVTANLASCPG
jgi:hypothetical protein